MINLVRKLNDKKNAGNWRESIAYLAMGKLEDRIENTLQDKPKERADIHTRLSMIKS